MQKVLGIGLAVLVVLVALGFGGRVYATRVMSARAVTPRILGSRTPAAAGLPFKRVAVESGERTLIGWWVRARADSGRVPPALLFFHGNHSAISDYVDLQKFLYGQGISSLVFDYSGFGASGGAPTLRNAIVDAGSVARVFEDSAGKAARKVAMGSGLGATVILQAIDSIQPHVSGVVIEGVDASVRESAVRAGHLPKFVAPLVVDLADNVQAASHVRVPLLAVHSTTDARVPITDSRRVIAAVPSQASLVRHWREGRSGILSSSRPCDWAPVLAFVKTGALPAAKIDSTNACEMEERAAAAANAAKSAAAAKTNATKSSPGATKQATKAAPKSTKGSTKTPAKQPPRPPTKKPPAAAAPIA